MQEQVGGEKAFQLIVKAEILYIWQRPSVWHYTLLLWTYFRASRGLASDLSYHEALTRASIFLSIQYLLHD